MNAIGIVAAVLMWGFGLAGIVSWLFLARWVLALGWAPRLRGSEPRPGVRALRSAFWFVGLCVAAMFAGAVGILFGGWPK
jgi:hypothetical protein